ncbi:RHS repeat-associated core domain-containing protein, partial [Streptomyces cyaneofuscatus]
NSMTRGGKNHYYLTDALGSVVALTDEAGTKVNTYAYSPRGVQRATTTEQVPQPYRFAGGYQDPTGLYHFSARYYDPSIGRFTTPDPSGQEQNPYLYAAGDPVNRIDPTGLLGFGSVVDGLFGAKDVAEIWQNRNDPKALVSQAVGIAAGAVFGGVCVAGTSTMATAAGAPYLIPLAIAGCGIAADTVSNVTAGAMEDSLS